MTGQRCRQPRWLGTVLVFLSDEGEALHIVAVLSDSAGADAVLALQPPSAAALSENPPPAGKPP